MPQSDPTAPATGYAVERCLAAASLWSVTLGLFFLLVAVDALRERIHGAWRTGGGALTDLAVEVAAFGLGALLGAWLLRTQARARTSNPAHDSAGSADQRHTAAAEGAR